MVMLLTYVFIFFIFPVTINYVRQLVSVQLRDHRIRSALGTDCDVVQ